MRNSLRNAAVFIITAMLALNASVAQAESSAREPMDYLGMDLATLWSEWGPPLDVYPVRGDRPDQDNVVFRYPGGLHLFWYRNRVWQVRMDAQFAGSVRGLRIGASLPEVLAELGRPVAAADDWLIYQFAGQGFPVRLRIFFGPHGVEDLYLYRSDY